EPPTKWEVKVDDKTTFTLVNIPPGGDKPTEGYTTQVWLADGSQDTAAKVALQGVVKERYQTLRGRVAAVAADGRGLTLELPPARDARGDGGRRGAEPRKVDVKFTDKTNVIYHGVGPGGARPTEGYSAGVILEDGSPDTAAQVYLFGPAGG